MRAIRSLALALPLALGQECLDDVEQLGLLQHAAVKSHEQQPIDESGEIGDEGDASHDGRSLFPNNENGPRAVHAPGAEKAAYDAEGTNAQKYHDLLFETVTYTNLGGLGPDTEDPSGILFERVTRLGDGSYVDMHFDAIDGYGTTVPTKNGVYGKLAAVNMLHGITSTFKVRFLKSGTDEPAVLGPFYWSINDLDQGSLGGGVETLAISGFESAYMLKNAINEVVVGNDGPLTTYTSSTAGNEADNPTDPMMLTDQQAGRTVSFKFPNGLSEFTFRYSVGGAAEPFPGHGDIGRHFQFSGMTSLYMCEPTKTLIDFSISNVASSNLGGMGPDFGAPEGIKFSNIASIGNGRSVDMEIHALTAYTPYNSTQNGLNGKFGQVNLHADSWVTLEFVFLEPGTTNRVNVEWFYFSVFDLDEARRGRNKESFEIDNRFFVTHYLTESSEVHVFPHFQQGTKENGGEGVLKYFSTTKGTGRDNPQDPMVLDQQQKDRSVAFLMHDISTFITTFRIAPPRRGGRNFNFAGAASVVFC